MKEPILYADNHWMDFVFVCNDYIHKLRTYEDKDQKLIIRIVKFANENIVSICAWRNSILIFDQKVNYVENQKYEISYVFDVIKEYESLQYTAPVEFKIDGNTVYECKRFMLPSEAKVLYKYLKQNHLISRPKWDSIIDGYDYKCLGCKYSWLSNPDVGYVRENKVEMVNAKEGIIRYPISTDPTLYSKSNWFSYKGKTYLPCDPKEYNQLTWYNKEEYAKVRDWHLKNCSSRKNDYPPFEELWEKKQQHRNDSGGYMWRRIDDHYDLVRNAKFCVSGGDDHLFERVVTLGYHTTKPKNAIQCPVCNDIYELFRSGYDPLNIFQKAKEIFWRKYAWRLSRALHSYRMKKYCKKELKKHDSN